MTDTTDRRADDPRISDHARTLEDHTRQIATLQTNYAHLSGKVGELASKQELQATEERIGEKFDTKFDALSKQVVETMTRLTDINEDIMTTQARQVEESHKKELQAKQAEIDRLKEEAASRRWDAIVDRVAKVLGLIAAFALALGLVWNLFVFASRQLPPDAAKQSPMSIIKK